MTTAPSEASSSDTRVFPPAMPPVNAILSMRGTLSSAINVPGVAACRKTPARLGSGFIRVCTSLALPKGKLMARILWLVIVVLVVLWLIGLLAKIGGGLIHILLVIALVVLVINLITGRKGV